MATKNYSFLALICTLALDSSSYAEGLLAVDNPAKNGKEVQLYAKLQAFEANDQVALSQYGGNWEGGYATRDGANLGLAVARSELGVQWNSYRLGLLYRGEILIETNRDTADLVHQYNTYSGYDLGRRYQVDFRIKGYDANGLRLSKSFESDGGDLWEMSWGVGLSYLRGKRIRLETVSGQVTTLNTQDVNAAIRMNDSNGQMNVADPGSFNAPYGQMPTLSGQGYALDWGMVLRHRESGASLEMAVSDLAGAVYWQNVPNNVADINTANKYYDANGYVHFDATAYRISSYQNLDQQLDPKVWLASSYPIGDFRIQMATSYTRQYWFPQIGGAYHLNQHWHINADYDLRFNSIGLLLHHDSFYLGWRGDGLKMDKAKSYGLNVGINISI